MRTERPVASAVEEVAEGTRRRVVDSEGPHTQFREEAAAAASSVATASRQGSVPIQVGVIRTINREASEAEAVAAKHMRYPVASVVKVGVWVPAVRMPSQAAVLVGAMCR
jgi:uncharacterized protein YhbP (UPF0306 family)